jgi:hypothetical protein
MAVKIISLTQLKPNVTAPIAVPMAQHFIGFARIQVVCSHLGPKLKLGPNQRPFNQAVLDTLWNGTGQGQHLLLDDPKNALIIFIDPKYIENHSVTANAHGPFQMVVFTEAGLAKKTKMDLNAGQHRVELMVLRFKATVDRLEVVEEKLLAKKQQDDELLKEQAALRLVLASAWWLGAFYSSLCLVSSPFC